MDTPGSACRSDQTAQPDGCPGAVGAGYLRGGQLCGHRPLRPTQRGMAAHLPGMAARHPLTRHAGTGLRPAGRGPLRRGLPGPGAGAFAPTGGRVVPVGGACVRGSHDRSLEPLHPDRNRLARAQTAAVDDKPKPVWMQSPWPSMLPTTSMRSIHSAPIFLPVRTPSEALPGEPDCGQKPSCRSEVPVRGVWQGLNRATNRIILCCASTGREVPSGNDRRVRLQRGSRFPGRAEQSCSLGRVHTTFRTSMMRAKTMKPRYMTSSLSQWVWTRRKPLRPPELPLDLVAPPVGLAVVVPGLAAVGPGRHHQFRGQPAGLVALTGAVHHQRRLLRQEVVVGQEAQLPQQLPSPGRVSGLARRQGADCGRPIVRGHRMKLGGPAAAGAADGLRSVCSTPVPSGCTGTIVLSSPATSRWMRTSPFSCRQANTRPGTPFLDPRFMRMQSCARDQSPRTASATCSRSRPHAGWR